MGLPLYILLGLLSVLGFSLGNLFFERRRTRARLKAQWGSTAMLKNSDRDLIEDQAAYFKRLKQDLPEEAYLDDTTWADLNMDAVFQSLDSTRSLTGSECLYACLRRTSESAEALAARASRVSYFETREEERIQVQEALDRISHAPFHGAWRFIFDAAYRYPPYQWVYPLLGALPFLILVLGFVKPAFFLGVPVSFGLNLVVFYLSQRDWEAEAAGIRHIASVLRCARKISRMNLGLKTEAETLKKELSAVSGVMRWVRLFGLQKQSDMDFVTDYVKIAFMLDMVSLVQILRHINKHTNAIKVLYELVGELDLDIALAMLKAREARLCAPEFSLESGLKATGLCHPLIPNAVPNPCCFDRCILLTGSNASGKSSYMRAVAVNAILAQTIGLVYAERFTMKRARVMSSIAIADDLLAGESYFIAEIKSLKRLIEAAKRQPDLLCFVDEVLRGTNTIERIAAAKTLLELLSESGALCMAATHDIELTTLLQAHYTNLHFTEEIREGRVVFSYKVLEGPSVSRNALALLEIMGYDARIVQSARALAQKFETTGTWTDK